MPQQEPARVGVHYENRTLRGVQQDAVRRFRADAVDGKKDFAQRRRFQREKPAQVPAELLARQGGE